MRDRPEHDNGRDRILPCAKSRGFCFARKGAPGRRNRVLRTGEFFSFFFRACPTFRDQLVFTPHTCLPRLFLSFSLLNAADGVLLSITHRSSSVSVQRAARSSHRSIRVYPPAACASPPSTSATSIIPDSTRTRSRNRAHTCGTRRRCDR